MPPVGPSSFQLVSDASQRIEVTWEYNKRLGLLLEDLGLEVFFQAQRGGAGFGSKRFWSHSLDSFNVGAALAALTSKIRIMSTVQTAYFHPAQVARQAATISQIAGPRWMLNLVSGWVKPDFDMLDIPFDDHAKRYRRTEEFVTVMKKFWTEDNFDYDGEFYRIRQGYCEPKPSEIPCLVNAGGSPVAKDFVAKHCDWYFVGSADPEQSRKDIAEVKEKAKEFNREVKFITYIFTLCRESTSQCEEEMEEVLSLRDNEAAQGIVEGLSGQTIGTFAQNFREGATVDEILEGVVVGVGSAKHIGTPKQVADQLAVLQEVGFDAVTTAFRHCEEELIQYGENVVPLLENMGVRRKR